MLKRLRRSISFLTIASGSTMKSGGHSLFGWLNSPLVITLVGTTFVTILITILTNNWEKQDSIRQLQRETLLVFADEYAKYLDTLPSLKSRAAYIVDARSRDEENRKPFSDNRSFDETIEVYEEIKLQLLGFRNPYSLTAQVSAAFASEKIERSVLELDKLVDCMDTTSELDKFLMLNEKARTTYRKLVATMGEQIHEE